ncbi:MAG: histidine phosphatase family protein [Azospirillaceae bacterium]|nr:histidine phosphatase family protein [Azospirillaceae bacterium]
MQLILSRHGNTFAAGDKVVWVGARSDNPLVESGRHQAWALGDALVRNQLVPSRIYAGPLRRTRQTAQIMAQTIGLDSAAVDSADELKEIDYGLWEGKSNDEIRQDCGDLAIDDWQQRSVWPTGYGWLPDEAEVIEHWNRLITRIRAENPRDSTIALVSSNGIFRIVAKTLGIGPGAAKMATGALSLLSETTDGRLTVTRWNQAPDLFGNAR